MKIEQNMSDQPILKIIGIRLAQTRLSENMTQAQLAKFAGVSKRTLERMENGGSSQLVALIRVCRVLGLVEHFNDLIPELPPSPMTQLKLRGRQRKRARPRTDSARYSEHNRTAGQFLLEEPKPGNWTWGDDT
ncbi:transcriptional regulator with XRE-family HTH domain [Ereboglobus sp. PH5-5]|uniref:helix-turn-helix transcriptional regulator n=1 Tax=unclassified Ereboglobus TaxID=2626932 RepID=UPI0024074881|nr:MULTISPECIES: helix-turn-helix transcriptional regulator [unclassified Ereboglobus]MDF9827570.1 transcriptional regulator with XRE-family HTH domain [Ereboglobus sp. PH5-10]MDF9833160.1 transcriptional regulator with XRE-family HTH domain [Ereboglobus sp. PH5-5]